MVLPFRQEHLEKCDATNRFFQAPPPSKEALLRGKFRSLFSTCNRRRDRALVRTVKLCRFFAANTSSTHVPGDAQTKIIHTAPWKLSDTLVSGAHT